MLEVLDQELERRGQRFGRYADDCNSPQCTSGPAGGEPEPVSGKEAQAQGKPGEECDSSPWGGPFLGFTFTFKGELKRRIAPQSWKRFKLRVRELTRAGRRLDLAHLVHRLRLYLTGWRSCLGFCETPSVLRNLDSWRRRLRMVFWRQWQGGWTRFASLRRLGVGCDLAAKTAGSAHGPWHLSRSPALSFALPNTYFISRGLPPLAPGR
jgi:RNA-directed DNA polymerase